MKTALIGFAGAGKSELFAALAGPAALHAGRAMVKVPEPRLQPLADLYHPPKITFTEIEFLDLPGAAGAKGGGLGDRVLNEVRPYDCLLAVLDGFSGAADPREQLQALEADFIIADLAVVEKRLERIAQDRKKAKHLHDVEEENALLQAREHLDKERPLRESPELSSQPKLKGFRFLSAKPVLWAWNVGEDALGGFIMPEAGEGVVHLAVSARLERELSEIQDLEERQAFMSDLGVEHSALDRVVGGVYALLGLITFLTAGDKEVRAWPLRRGLPAVEAAGVIHSDIQRGFIRAEVLGWEDFLACRTFKTAKERGLLRLEGKDYIVKDGDIIEFRFNV
ncbi:MAG TPA: redox-regulated ATPase YchF [Desulfonatronum sp.]|nr:redox-regulated ATPase YchF [Desulfonatronum sp.]